MRGNERVCFSVPAMTVGEDMARAQPQRNSLNAPALNAFEHFNNDRARRMIKDLWYKNSVYLLSVGRHLHGRERRRHRRFPGPDAPARLSHGLGITAIWLMPFQTSPGKDDGYDISRLLRRQSGLRDRSAISSNSRMAPSNAASACSSISSSITPPNEHPWFQEARRDPNSKYRDWYVWSKKRPAKCRQGHGVSGRAEDHMVARSGSEGMVLPPLLRLPTRPQHVQSRGAGRDPEDHGLLDSARRVRLSHGCRALHHRHQGCRRQASRASNTTCCARSANSCSGASAIRSSSPKRTSCRRPTCSISATTAIACT